jgi:hypothetical protein
MDCMKTAKIALITVGTLGVLGTAAVTARLFSQDKKMHPNGVTNMPTFAEIWLYPYSEKVFEGPNPIGLTCLLSIALIAAGLLIKK